MSAALCIDASISVKWLIWEEQTDLALRLAHKTRDLGDWIVGPPHLPVEVTSALYRRLREGDLTDYEAFEGASTFAELPIEVINPPALPVKAMQLASKLDLKTIRRLLPGTWSRRQPASQFASASSDRGRLPLTAFRQP